MHSKSTYLLTSEYVGRGHPDKVADQISDAILDAVLRRNPDSKVACETLVKGNHVVLAGEITDTGIDYDAVVRRTMSDIGYNKAELGFDSHTVTTHNMITEQSPEINKAVDKEDGVVGAGDQGIMFGYAADETESFMPLHLDLAHRIIRKAEELQNDGLARFYPDCKAQVTVEYDAKTHKPLRITHVVFSTQHHQDLALSGVKEIFHELILPQILTLKEVEMCLDSSGNTITKFFVNPAGSWHHGGPAQDAGLTGRKIVVDNYGAACQVGGGAFSGKDPTKVDRSAAYAARHIAANLVSFGFASRAQVQLSYAIGVSEPISVRIMTDEGALDRSYESIVRKLWDLSPGGIIERFDLKKPIYYNTAAKGHFGRLSGPHPPWDLTDMEALKGYL